MSYLVSDIHVDISIHFGRPILSNSPPSASVTSFVFALSPKFGVETPAAHTFPTTLIRVSAASCSHSQPIILAADKKVAIGFAIPFPVIPKALIWTGLKKLAFVLAGSKLFDAAIPIDPAKAAGRSDKMSIWNFISKLVFRLVGFHYSHSHGINKYLSPLTSGKFFETSFATSSQRTFPFLRELLFVTTISSFPDLFLAVSRASRMICPVHS